MDVHYIEVRYEINEFKNLEELIRILPNRIGIVSTLQYLDAAQKIKEILEKRGFDVRVGKSPYMKYEMQVLGCDPFAADVDAETILFVGDGLFHPLEIARRLRKRVISYSPLTGNINVIEDRDSFEKKIYLLLSKLKESKVIGFVTTIKPGQYLYNEMKKWKKILENQNKKVIYFIGDNIDLDSLQNFPDIEFWVIFACPRIIDDILEKKFNGITLFYLAKYCRHHGLCEAPQS